MPQLFSWDERLDYLRRYGSHATAYSTLQPGLEYFDMETVGYIAYKQIGTFWKTTHVLGDPVADPEKKSEIIDAFIQEFHRSNFYQIQSDTAVYLHAAHGYCMNECGLESVIPIENFSLEGRKMQDIRRYRNVCERSGVRVFESSIAAIGAAVLQRISAEWMRSKIVSGNELAFLARPLTAWDEPDVRCFFARKDEEIIGFAVFDPIYQNQRIVGYQNVIQRAKNNVPKGTLDYINLHVIEQFKHEKKGFLSLGLAPLVAMERLPGFDSPFIHLLFKTFYEKGNFMYGFKRLEFHKERYRAIKRKNYFSSHSAFPIKDILDGYMLCRVLTFKNMWELVKKQIAAIRPGRWSAPVFPKTKMALQ